MFYRMGVIACCIVGIGIYHLLCTLALCFVEPELLLMEVLHCGNRDFGPLLLL